MRGLNSPARKNALREFVESVRVTIICIFETKLESVDQFVIMQCVGPAYDGFLYLPASDTRGGIFVAWDSTKMQLTNFANDTNFTTSYVSPLEGPS